MSGNDLDEMTTSPEGETKAPKEVPLSGTSGFFVQRVLWPVLVPLAAIACVGFVALNLSRLFLASGGHRAVAAAAIVGITILGGAVFATTRDRLTRSGIMVGAAVAGVVIVSVGLVAQQVDNDHVKKEAEADVVTYSSQVTEEAVDIDFKEKSLAAKAGTIGVTLKNSGVGVHTFTVEGFESQEIQASGGASATGGVKLTAGTYTFYCSIPGHRSAGMQGTLAVT